MSHSTKTGLSFLGDGAPIMASWPRRPEESPVATASERLTPGCAFDPGAFPLPPLFASAAVAVGQSRTIVSRLGFPRPAKCVLPSPGQPFCEVP